MKKIILLVLAVMFTTTVWASNYYYNNRVNLGNGDYKSDPMFKIGVPEVNTVSVSKLKTCSSDPACVLPDIDANYIYVIEGVTLFTNYDTNAFDANSNGTIGLYYFDGTSTYTAATGTCTETQLLGTSAYDRMTHLLPVAQNGLASLYNGKGLYLYSTKGNATSANSKTTVNIVVNYSIQRTGL
jgi:hypothetical protein